MADIIVKGGNILVRRDTLANFAGYVPKNGEPIGIIGDDGKVTAYKIGDGTTDATQLPALSKGDIGPRGPQGLPGTNGVATDDAVGANLSTAGTKSRAALTSLYGTAIAGPGIDPTGAADSTAAINALIANGGRFHGTPGAIYKVSQLTVPTGTRLVGFGATIASTVTAAGAGILRVEGATDVDISGFAFTGALRTVAVRVANSSRVRVTGNTCTTVGVFLSTSSTDVYSSSGEGDCRGITVADNVADAANDNNGYPAISFRYTSEAVASGNRITGYGHGIMWWGGDAAQDLAGVQKAQRITITGNVITNVGAAAIWGSMGRNIAVTGNTCLGGGDLGIDFEGSSFCTASGNTVENFTNGGLAVFFGASSCTFTGNTVTQAAGPAFASLSPTTSIRVVVSGNIFFSATSPIGVIQCDERSLSDSVFSNNDIVTTGAGVEIARFNQCDRIKFLNNTGRNAHTTGTTNYGGVDCLWEGNQLSTSADTSSVGQGGGIRFDWVSSAKSAQRMRVRGNVLIGYVTGIMDNCGGDVTSYAVIEFNRAATIWHRGTTAYMGLIADNRTSNPNTATPVTAVA